MAKTGMAHLAPTSQRQEKVVRPACAEVECIGKGNARQPYEFDVKVSLAITQKQGLIVGARAFPGNPYDGDMLAEQLEQTSILLQDVPGALRTKTALSTSGFVASMLRSRSCTSCIAASVKRCRARNGAGSNRVRPSSRSSAT